MFKYLLLLLHIKLGYHKVKHLCVHIHESVETVAVALSKRCSFSQHKNISSTNGVILEAGLCLTNQ